jgi:type I restriction enzyme M protein
MARMNAFIHDLEAEIAMGDTMTNPRFTQRDGSLRRFDRVTANPMWNQKFAGSLYENDTWGRFTRGVPPTSSADWGWIQHMHASLADTGKLAVVLDTEWSANWLSFERSELPLPPSQAVACT